ncbi:MAG TPA: thioredoxin [Rhodopirellula sp.]|nr:thioredoxin [Rhodopirellula sp.]
MRARSLSVGAAVFFAWSTIGAGLRCVVEAQEPGSRPVLLQMIRDDAVHQELKLSDQQKTGILSALRAVDGPWFRSRNLKGRMRESEIRKLDEQLEMKLQYILNASQQKRLLQLQYQALGTRMLLREDVATSLELSKQQRENLVSAFQATDKEIIELSEQNVNAEQREQLKRQELAVVDQELTDVQERRLGLLTGTAFDFSLVRRTYPLAPELSLDGAQWIQGEATELAGLRGKVVAIHFYAYQCINCQRNLPFYTAWNKDYSDRGLVVIGIQTPETAAERDAEKVAAAAKREGIEYPLLLDLKSSNWKNWSNTMWPTIYLVDRKGFLRRWWQGELNWNGGNGEQQMRATIEKLLAEQD